MAKIEYEGRRRCGMTAWPSSAPNLNDRAPWDGTKAEWRDFFIERTQNFEAEQDLASEYNDWNVSLDRPPREVVLSAPTIFGDETDDEPHVVWEVIEYGSGRATWHSVDGIQQSSFGSGWEDEGWESETEVYRPGTLLDVSEGTLATPPIQFLSQQRIDAEIVAMLPSLEKMAWGFGRSYGWSEASVLDLAQEAVVHLLERGATYRGHSSFRTYAIRVAHNKMVDVVRSWKSRTTHERLCGIADFDLIVQSDSEQVADPCYDAVWYREVVAAMAKHRQAEVLTRAALYGDDRELASELGISLDAARQRRLRAARQFLPDIGEKLA